MANITLKSLLALHLIDSEERHTCDEYQVIDYDYPIDLATLL